MSGLGFLFGISVCGVFLNILFPLIYSNRLKCEGWGWEKFCAIPTTMTHFLQWTPASTVGASLVYVPAPLWIEVVSVKMFLVAWHQLTRQLILLRSTFVCPCLGLLSIQALSDSSKLFSLHSQGFTIVSDSTTNFLCLPNSSPHSMSPLTQCQARQLKKCLSFFCPFVIITITM